MTTALPPAQKPPASAFVTPAEITVSTASSGLPVDTPPPVGTKPPPPGIEDASGYAWQPITGGLEMPLEAVHAGDGSGRLFVLEQRGRIQVIQEGNLLPQLFLDISDRVGSSGNEQGLLGIAFHPDYPANGYFYVNYTDLQGDTVIARFTVSPDNPNQALPGSEYQLIWVDQPFANHNGGEVVFGPDGYLYLGLGDGGSQGDPQENGQSRDALLGKILRIDVDSGTPYAIPPSNPYARGGGRSEIFAEGLRNPWRFSFDSLTGDLYIGDVGQNAWEEIDHLPAADVAQDDRPAAFNFGWNLFEGTHAYLPDAPAGIETIFPIAEYSHEFGCSVTGGFVYRGSRLPALVGIYFFGDYCSGTVWGLWPDLGGGWQQKVLFETQGQITSFGQDEDGEILLVDRAGIIYRLAEN
jgi:glucose/arabinose dehydrogenase